VLIIITRYRLEEQAVFTIVKSLESIACPLCGGVLLSRSLRERKVINSGGVKIKLCIRRLRCESCKRHHHELPDCVVPYKRHSAETIENIISGADEVEEHRTAGRLVLWWQIVLPYFLNILKSLARKHKITPNKAPAFREVVRAAVNSAGWIFAWEICTRSASAFG
jgi:hypothetical protein